MFDSGCTTHIACRKEYFSELKLEQTGNVAGVAGSVPILGHGTVLLDNIRLIDVAYVPALPFNLISIKKATDTSGYKFTFTNDSVLSATPEGTINSIGFRKKGLYVFGALETNKSMPASRYTMFGQDVSYVSRSHSYDPLLSVRKEKISDSSLIHARLGHPGPELYNRIAHALNLPSMSPNQVTLCPTCLLSKELIHKGKVASTVYKSPLQLIQADLCGGFRYKSFTSDKYFLTIRDAYSRYYSVIHLKKKSDAAENFINWITESENYFASRGGFKVGAVRTDNGCEFVNYTLHEFFKKKGISHQLTIPNSSYQNGAVERAHRTIEEKTRCLLVGGRIPPSMWPEAVSCAVYLINRTPIPTKNNAIPLCLWRQISSSAISLDHLRIFGCSAYAVLPPSHRDGKFAPTSISGIHVGYDSNHKGYRIYHPPSRKIFISSQVKFEEAIFPLFESKQTIDSHDFATSVVGGAPQYPATGADASVPSKPVIFDNVTNYNKDTDNIDQHTSTKISDQNISIETPDRNAEESEDEEMGIDTQSETRMSVPVSSDGQGPSSLSHNQLSHSHQNKRQHTLFDSDSTNSSILGKTSKKRSVQLPSIKGQLPLVSQAITPTGNTVTHIAKIFPNHSLPPKYIPLNEMHGKIIEEHVSKWTSGVPVGDLSIPQLHNSDSNAQSIVIATEGNEPGNQLVKTVLTPGCTDLPSSPPSDSSDSSQSLTNLPGKHAALTAVASAFGTSAVSSSVPKSIQQALDGCDGSKWREACLKELSAFTSHNTFELTPLPPSTHCLGSRWVLTIKDDGRLKARLVAQGHRQREGIDYNETFAPVVRYTSVRVFLALSACLCLAVHQMAVDTAFLNPKLPETVYVRQPPMFSNRTHPDWVWKLKGGMYGLRQAPLLWNNHIHESLTSLGFKRHEGEHGLYFKQSSVGLVLVALYIDDLLIAAPSLLLVKNVKAALSSRYSIKDLGVVDKFLGMNITQNDDTITLHMADYITSAASISKVVFHKQVPTPLSPSVNYFDDSSPPVENITIYQSIIGQLLFIANAGRPDVAYPVSLLSRFLKDPRKVHLQAAHRVMQYLYSTRYLGISYRMGSPISLTIYSDASQGSTTDIPYSTGGYVTRLASGIITWSSKKIKTTICLSSTEAEYIAASEAVRKIEWLNNLLEYMKIPFLPVILYVDNMPAIQVANNPVFHNKTKHIALRHHKIRRAVADGTVIIEHVSTKDQVADIMTKILPRGQFQVLTKALVQEVLS